MRVKAETAVNQVSIAMGLAIFTFLTFSFIFLALHG